jgi:HPt (histidine-containing phosphotransfer) domain-containing protein
LFEGGHFFLLENRDAFLASLAYDLGHESEWALSAALSTLWKAGKRDTVFKLLRAFLDSVALQIKTLRGADRDLLWETAHTLAGSCSEYGAVAMGQTASTLQALAATGDLSDAGLLIDTLKQQFLRVMHGVADFSKNSN